MLWAENSSFRKDNHSTEKQVCVVHILKHCCTAPDTKAAIYLIIVTKLMNNNNYCNHWALIAHQHSINSLFVLPALTTSSLS